MTSSEGSPTGAKRTRRSNGEGTAPTQRKDGRWQVQVTLVDSFGDKRRVPVYGATRAKCVANVKALKKRVDEGAPAAISKMTVAQYAQEWCETTLQVSKRAYGTKAHYAGQIRTHLIPSKLGRRALSSVTGAHVEGFIAELQAKELSVSSIAANFYTLRTLFATAQRDRLIGRNPTDDVKVATSRSSRFEVRWLDGEELTAVLAALSSSRHCLFFDLLAATGLRRGEALGLTWQHVDLDEGVLYVAHNLSKRAGKRAAVLSTTKTRSSEREVPLTPRAQRTLRKLRQRQREDRLAAGSKYVDSDFVFTGELGEQVALEAPLKALKVALKRANLPDCTVHTFRHTAATGMLNSGVELTTVSRVLGHTSTQMTSDLYIHVSKKVKRDALDKWGEAMG